MLSVLYLRRRPTFAGDVCCSRTDPVHRRPAAPANSVQERQQQSPCWPSRPQSFHRGWCHSPRSQGCGHPQFCADGSLFYAPAGPHLLTVARNGQCCVCAEAAVDASAHTQHLNEGFLLADWRKSKFLSVATTRSPEYNVPDRCHRSICSGSTGRRRPAARVIPETAATPLAPRKFRHSD